MSRQLLFRAAAVIVLASGRTPAAAQGIAPAGFVRHAARTQLSIDSEVRAVRVVEQSEWGSNRRRSAVVGGIVGMSVGVALGYSLARLGHRAYCEGASQCAEYPRRGVAAAMWTGGVIGFALGTTVGWAGG